MTSASAHPHVHSLKGDMKVHFHEAQEHSSNSPSPAASASSSDTESSPSYKSPAGLLRRTHSHNGHTRHENASNNAADNRVRSHSSSSSNTFVGRVLTVSPADELVFQPRGSGDPFDTIILANTLPYPVAFKVKTTSPEKFRVRPSSGLVQPQKTEEVFVYLISDHIENVKREKFLIMAIDTKGDCGDANQLFKDTPKEMIMQHKLRCSFGSQSQLIEQSKSSLNGTTSEEQQSLASRLEQIEAQTLYMHQRLNILLLIQFLTAIFLLLVVLSFSCFGQDLFTRFLILPFDFCHAGHGHNYTR
ncbi:hypothetical protein BsWGS_27361 [Bradybaena similaris]